MIGAIKKGSMASLVCLVEYFEAKNPMPVAKIANTKESRKDW